MWMTGQRRCSHCMMIGWQVKPYKTKFVFEVENRISFLNIAPKILENKLNSLFEFFGSTTGWEWNFWPAENMYKWSIWASYVRHGGKSQRWRGSWPPGTKGENKTWRSGNLFRLKHIGFGGNGYTYKNISLPFPKPVHQKYSEMTIWHEYLQNHSAGAK